MQDKFKPPTQTQKKKYSKYLAPDEEILVVTGISNLYFWSQLFRFLTPPLMLFVLAFLLISTEFKILGIILGVFGVVLFFFLVPAIVRLIRKKQSFHYVLTNKRCLIVQGIFSRKLITAPLAAITHITVEQSLTERFFYHCGQIVVITAGYDPREIVIENIDHPVEFKVLTDHLASQLEKEGEEKPQAEKPVVSKSQFRLLKLN